MAFGGGYLWEVISHESFTLMNGISVLIKETPQGWLPYLSITSGHTENTASYEPEHGLSPDMELSSDFPASRKVRNKFMLFISHPVFQYFWYSILNGLKQCICQS